MENTLLPWLSFLSESPVPLPEQYINKKIETVSETDGIITIGFNEADNIEPLKGKLLRVHKDITGLPGSSISWFLSNPKSITFEGDDAEPREVTLAEIFKEPLACHGKRERVAGYFNPEFENMNVSDISENGIWPAGRGVWIGGISTFCEEGTSQMAGAVTIDGTFIFGPGGHFGHWPGEIARPTRFVRTKEGAR